MEIETFHNNPGTFCETALPFLMETETENNLLIGISLSLAKTSSLADCHERFFWVVHNGITICGAAMWRPPYDLLLSHPFSYPALAALSEYLIRRHVSLPGIFGPNYAASEFARNWTEATSLAANLWCEERIYELRQVESLTLPQGRIAQAERDRVDLLCPWVTGLLHETGEKGDSLAMLDASISDGRLFLWFDGNPVSMAAWTGPTMNGVCINMIYTPPEFRHRGYATAVVSSLSSMLLCQGKSFCVLYADLSNPTSNNIYQRIGYKPILDCFHYRFVRRDNVTQAA
jgi:predicted GNAT family acetyltransferase